MNKLLFFLFILTCAGCKKSNFDPEPPKIEFGGWNYLQTDSAGHDRLVEMIITFKDRNGDIGRIESEQFDKCGRAQYDLFIFYEKKENSIYTPVFWNQPDSALDQNCNLVPGSYSPTSQINFKRALTYVQPEGNNRSIEGEISYQMDYESALINLNPTGHFKVYLLDRARNKSNEIYTDDLVLK